MNVSQPSELSLFKFNGVSISFFIDISNIQDGTTLIRQLKVSLVLFVRPTADFASRQKRHGGTVVHTADDAQILLVDHDEPSSVQLAAEWPDKLALHFAWVYRCINGGKYLGPAENWAGFRVGSGAGGQQIIDATK